MDSQEWTNKALDYAPEKIDTTRTPAELEAERKALDQSITEASRAYVVPSSVSCCGSI